MVDTGEKRMPAAVTLEGVGRVEAETRAIVLACESAKGENPFERPKDLVPIASAIHGVSGSFEQTFPAYSVTVMRVRSK